jgi:NAD(P)-dependent dehydrogenase (short-subunit alcohol dehydrogenase family)
VHQTVLVRALRGGLAAEGAAVVVNYASSRADAERVVAEIKSRGGIAMAVQGDVSKGSDIQRLFAVTKQAFGKLDVLVNSAPETAKITCGRRKSTHVDVGWHGSYWAA